MDLVLGIIGLAVFVFGVLYNIITGKKLGWIVALIGFAFIILTLGLSWKSEAEAVNKGVSRYKTSIKSGYSVYLDGSKVDGTKLIMNSTTYKNCIIKYDADDKTVLITRR